MNNEQNLSELKNKFKSLEKKRKVINNLFTAINDIIDKLTQLYKELTKPNNTELYIICLDTFHFQKVLLSMEYKELESSYTTISNRLYCDYYKLSKLILNYIRANFNSHKNTEKTEQNILKKITIFNKYPTYDDLDIHKEYSFADVISIYNDIVGLLFTLNENIVSKKLNLEAYKKKSENGLKIDNFVYSYESNLNDVDNKLKLFCNYALFFVDTHNTYFDKFLTKINLVYNQIAEDIKLEETFIDSNVDNDDDNTMKFKIENELNLTLQQTDSIIHKKSLIQNLHSISPTSHLSSPTSLPFKRIIPSPDVENKVNVNTESQPSSSIENKDNEESIKIDIANTDDEKSSSTETVSEDTFLNGIEKQ